jgi:hypothetical protein
LHGQGYWLKLSKTPEESVYGIPQLRSADTVSLNAGWNLIGSVGTALPVSTFLAANANLLPYVFGYDQGYFLATSIDVYHGYWVNAITSGNAVLNPSNGKVSSSASLPEFLGTCNTVTITDKAGNKRTLYFAPNSGIPTAFRGLDLPPAGPVGTFDARFASGKLIEASDLAHTSNINLTSPTYPLSVTWHMAKGGSVSLVVNGKNVSLTHDGTTKVTKGGNLSMNFGASSDIPGAFALRQNYPNPFNPSTLIQYALPSDVHVTLKVYNMLGQEVSTLVDGMQTAGEKTVRFDGSRLASGVYFYNITAGSFHASKSMSIIK